MVVIRMVVEGVGDSQLKTTPLTGKAASFDASRTYLTAPGTALQLMPNDSHGWKLVPPLGRFSDGFAGNPALTPVTVKLRGADQAPWTNAPLTAWTRQKYVPFARPLTVSVLVGAVTEFCRAILANVDVALTC